MTRAPRTLIVRHCTTDRILGYTLAILGIVLTGLGTFVLQQVWIQGQWQAAADGRLARIEAAVGVHSNDAGNTSHIAPGR